MGEDVTLYKNLKSDFILGDFWGIDEVVPGFNDGYGVSAIITNSDKGNKIFDLVRSKFIAEEVKLEDIIKGNPSLVNSSKYILEHYYFLEYLNEMDIIPEL